MAEINAAVAASRTAEGALHAYLLSDSPTQQVAFRNAFAELAERLEVAKALAGVDPAETASLAELENALLARADRARELLTAHRAGHDEIVQEQLLIEDEDSGLEVSRLAQRILSRQQVLLRDRDRIAFEKDAAAHTTLYIGAGLNILLLIAAGWFIRDNLKSRQRETELLAQSNQDLEVRVRARTAELAQKNNELRTENLESRWKAEALDHQLRYNHLIIASVASPVLVITRALNISRINPAMERVAGQTASELVDRQLSELVVLTSDPETSSPLDPIDTALRVGRDLVDQPGELRLAHRPPLRVLLSLFPLRDQDHIVGGVVTLRVLSSA
jgi:PAS domain-containing protein